MTGFLVDRKIDKYVKSTGLNETDLFYLCFLIGISSGNKKKLDSTSSKNTGAGKGWTQGLAKYRELIALTLLSADSKRSSMITKADIEDLLGNYTDVDAQSKNWRYK